MINTIRYKKVNYIKKYGAFLMNIMFTTQHQKKQNNYGFFLYSTFYALKA